MSGMTVLLAEGAGERRAKKIMEVMPRGGKLGVQALACHAPGEEKQAKACTPNFPPPHSRAVFTTGIVTLDGKRLVRRTRCVAFRKSLAFASKIFRTKVCGFLSIIGNHVL
jgi:hypothetical protein